MKRVLFILFSSFLVLTVYAQSKEYRGFLLDKFENGKAVYKKDNQVTESLFNYETITEKMIFMLPDSTMLELARPDIISAVIIGSRVFEHVGYGIFYEKVNVGDDFLYIRWKTSVKSKGKSAGYGIVTGTGRVDDAIQYTTSTSGVHELKSSEKFSVDADNGYYLKIKNKFKRFDSFDSLAKMFKGNDAEIKEYVKAENLSFKNIEDIKKAVAYVQKYRNGN